MSECALERLSLGDRDVRLAHAGAAASPRARSAARPRPARRAGPGPPSTTSPGRSSTAAAVFEHYVRSAEKRSTIDPSAGGALPDELPMRIHLITAESPQSRRLRGSRLIQF